jgi:hypothetical protein
VQRVLPSVACLSVISKLHRGRIGPTGLLIHERKLFTEQRRVIKRGENLNFKWQSDGKNYTHMRDKRNAH